MNMPTKRKRRTLIAIGIIAFTALAWLFMRPSQPTYDGETLTHWIAVLGSSDTDEEAHAFAAIQAIGTNGLPTILRLLESGDSGMKFRCLRLIGHVPFLNLRFDTAAEKRQKGKLALILAGEEAQHSSIPALAHLSRAADAGVRLTAVDCLSQFMFNEPEVLSALEAAQSDADAQVSTKARDAVRRHQGVGDAVQRLQGTQAR